MRNDKTEYRIVWAFVIAIIALMVVCAAVGRHPALDNTVPVVDVLCIGDRCDTLRYNVISFAGIEEAVVRMSGDTVYITVRREK